MRLQSNWLQELCHLPVWKVVGSNVFAMERKYSYEEYIPDIGIDMYGNAVAKLWNQTWYAKTPKS
jgi:hypothetical protein